MTILEKVPIYTSNPIFGHIVAIGFLMIIVSMLALMPLAELGSDKIAAIPLIFVGLGFIALMTGIILFCNIQVETGRYRYTIKCDESISINELYNNYKIIDHPKYSDIYVVEEINGEY